MDIEKQTKRLRGWQLEREKTKSQALPCQKVKKSNLSMLLLSLWSHGHLSAKLSQEIAHMAVLDGAEGEELATMASAGTWGSHPGNCHRDFMTHFFHDVKIPMAQDVVVTCKDPKTSKSSNEKANIMLPHLLFSDLACNYRDQFNMLFGIEHLVGFWSSIEHVKDDRLLCHPICLDKRLGKQTACVQDKALTIPLFMHADGAEYQVRDSLLIWSWGGLLNAFSSLAGHFLICGYPKSCTMQETWEPLMKWLKWSLEALQDGIHPCVGPDEEPLPKGSVFERLAGQSLTAAGHRAVVWSLQGDHEMYSNVLHLPHWSNVAPCWECDCMRPLTKGEPCPAGKSFKLLRPSEQRFEYIKNPEALTKGKSKHMLFDIPGLSTRMVRHDGLHVLFVHGVCGHLLGGILHFLCFWDGKGKQSVKPSDRLATLFTQIQDKYKQFGTTTRLTNLKMSMVVDMKKPHGSWPALQCKGAETKGFMKPCLETIKLLLSKEDPLHQSMVQSLQALVELVDLFDQADLFLSRAEYSQAVDLGKRFFDHYQDLVDWAKSEDRMLWNVTIKFHMLHHLILNAKEINPKYCWNWRGEDFVGKVSRLGMSCCMGLKTTKLSCKLMDKYRILLHLQLEKIGFNTEIYQEDTGST